MSAQHRQRYGILTIAFIAIVATFFIVSRWYLSTSDQHGIPKGGQRAWGWRTPPSKRQVMSNASSPFTSSSMPFNEVDCATQDTYTVTVAATTVFITGSMDRMVTTKSTMSTFSNGALNQTTSTTSTQPLTYQTGSTEVSKVLTLDESFAESTYKTTPTSNLTLSTGNATSMLNTSNGTVSWSTRIGSRTVAQSRTTTIGSTKLDTTSLGSTLLPAFNSSTLVSTVSLNSTQTSSATIYPLIATTFQTIETTSISGSSTFVSQVVIPTTMTAYEVVPEASVTMSAGNSSVPMPSSAPWTPPSIDYMQANMTDSKGGALVPEGAYQFIMDSTRNMNESLILPPDQTGDCIPLPDDPCVDIDEALDDEDVREWFFGDQDSNSNENHDHNDNDDNDHHDGDDDDDDDDDRDIIAGVLGGVGGGIAASALGAFAWYHRHKMTWKFGEFLFHRSRNMWDFFRSRLRPADIPRWGFNPPRLPQLPGLPVPPVPQLPAPPSPPSIPLPPGPPSGPPPPIPPNIPLPPSPPGSPPGSPNPADVPLPPSPPGSPNPNKPRPNDVKPENEPEDPDDDDCPPKLQKAQADLQAKDREIAKLKQDLKNEQDHKKKAEDDLDDCDEELKRLHQAQEQLKKIRSRQSAKKLREADRQLRDKQKLVDQLLKQSSEQGGDNASLKQQLEQAKSDLKNAREQHDATLKHAESNLELAKAAQDQVQMWVDMNACFENDLAQSQSDNSVCQRQLDAFRNILHKTESKLKDANNRASTAEGVKSANEAEIARLLEENKQMAQHTCPVSILSQPMTCQHTNEEIARMKLNLEACEFDRRKLRRVNTRPDPNEDDLPLADQLALCRRRWQKSLADKASLHAEYDTMTESARKEIKRLKEDLADCRKTLNGPGSKPSDNTSPLKPSNDNPEVPKPGTTASRISALEKEIASCKAQKAEIEKGKCPAKGTPPPSPPQSPFGGYGDAASDPRAATLEGCHDVLNEASSDAHECYTQCTCPAGVTEGPDHLRRRGLVDAWLKMVAGNGTMDGNRTVAAAAA